MGTQDQHTAAPIFVVGSPRSGTSILTWCLGQHPNILPTEESAWLGLFAAQAAVHHRTGCLRGERSQLSALGIDCEEFFQCLGNAIDTMICGHRLTFESLNHAAAQRNPGQVCAEFAIARSHAEPKSRWVDGTPEYSLYICGLHKLFPAAKFVHIVRDPDEVVASMLAFRHEDGQPLVSSTEEAYQYWERTTFACLLAAQALGAEFVLRVRHADLVARPETALRAVFDFLGEAFAPDCVAPLARRINSSFAERPAVRPGMPGLSAAAESARRLLVQLEPAVGTAGADALVQFENGFAAQVRFQATVEAQLRVACDRNGELQASAQAAEAACIAEHERNTRLRSMVDWCGILIAVPCALALMLYAFGKDGAAAAVVPSIAMSALFAYAWLRRAGVQRLLGRLAPAKSGIQRSMR
jgi:hypothetical protein